MRENLVGPGNAAHLDREDVREGQRIVVAQEHQLPVDFGECPSVGHASVHAPLFKAENGAVGRMLPENPRIASFIKMRDAALFKQPAIQFLRRGQFDELAGHNEYQFATRFEVAHAFFDEKKEKIAAPVE